MVVLCNWLHTAQVLRILCHNVWLLPVQRHQESYMRRELQWEATVARLQQQLAQLKGEGDHKAAEDAAEGQAKQLTSIRSAFLSLPGSSIILCKVVSVPC